MSYFYQIVYGDLLSSIHEDLELAFGSYAATRELCKIFVYRDDINSRESGTIPTSRLDTLLTRRKKPRILIVFSIRANI